MNNIRSTSGEPVRCGRLPAICRPQRSGGTRKTTTKRGFIIFLLLLTAFPLLTPAQQSTPGGSLTNIQKEGRRVFVQFCSVCHTPVTIVSKTYGAYISKEMVTGKEDNVRSIIMKGVETLMPGFQYGLKPSEINAIIEYLKTVPKPGSTGAAPPRE